MADETKTIDNKITGGRITTEQFYQRLLDLKDEMHEMESRLSCKINEIAVQEARITDIKNDVESLKRTSTLWTGLNSIAIVIATIIAAVFGR